MNLSHFSSRPIKGIRHIPDVEARAGHMKPAGFWVSVDGDDDWPTWCERNEWTDTKKQFHYQVFLAPESKILRLSSVQELEDFTAQYGIHGEYHVKIDWKSVSQSYQGLIIAPYQWKCRLDLDWYYGWDCQSGVIWDISAMDKIQLLRKPLENAA